LLLTVNTVTCSTPSVSVTPLPDNGAFPAKIVAFARVIVKTSYKKKALTKISC
jgi:hypothetical protein